MNQALFSLLRGGFPEVTFYGEISVVAHERDFGTTELKTAYPARSLLKPFQFLAAGLSPERWSGEEKNRYVAATGSISATRHQVDALEKWYSGNEMKERIAKICFAPTYPMDDAHRVYLKESGIKPRYMHHNCFSKHMAILECCATNGWSLENYQSTTHPYHKRLMTTLSVLIGEDGPFETVEDGCLLPSPVLTLRQMALLYQGLANPKRDGRMTKIRDLMLSDPEWVGGPGRFDTRLMQENPGRVIAKEGADGLLGIAVLPDEKNPSGVGIVVKSLAGFQPAMTALAVSPIFTALGLKPVGDTPRGQTIEYHYQPFQTTSGLHDLSPVISERIANWPGDVAFRRKISCDAFHGDHLTLSSIETSLHVGTHTDAPNHASGIAQGIEAVALSRYRGICQVVTIGKPKGSLISNEDLRSLKVRAPRIIIRTGSFPDPEHFNEDFVAMTADAIEWLADQGVVLVGVDTPSIDSFSSKTLPAHHAVGNRGLSILEGVVLTGIKDGLYELSSLPLRIEGADASPVRVVLEEISPYSPKGISSKKVDNIRVTQ